MVTTKNKTFAINEEVLKKFEILCGSKGYKQSQTIVMLMNAFCVHEMELFKKINENKI